MAPHTHPGAAAGLREGLGETLTVIRLDVPPTLARTMRSTNPVERMGAPQACSKRRSSAARSTGTSTCPHYAPPSNAMSPMDPVPGVTRDR